MRAEKLKFDRAKRSKNITSALLLSANLSREAHISLAAMSLKFEFMSCCSFKTWDGFADSCLKRQRNLWQLALQANMSLLSWEFKHPENLVPSDTVESIFVLSKHINLHVWHSLRLLEALYNCEYWQRIFKVFLFYTVKFRCSKISASLPAILRPQ